MANLDLKLLKIITFVIITNSIQISLKIWKTRILQPLSFPLQWWGETSVWKLSRERYSYEGAINFRYEWPFTYFSCESVFKTLQVEFLKKFNVQKYTPKMKFDSWLDGCQYCMANTCDERLLWPYYFLRRIWFTYVLTYSMCT